MKSCNRLWNFYAKLLKFKNLSEFKSTGLILKKCYYEHKKKL